jgi:hypothetical protein
MKIDRAIEQVQNAETDLAAELRTVGERHSIESDVYHVSHLLASRCASQLERLLPHAKRYGAPEHSEAKETPAVVERLRRMNSELTSRQESSGMLLLEDLRDVYLTAHRAELAWLILSQGARATRDPELLAAAREGREEAERRWRWLRTKIQESSPQVLVAS